MSKQDFKIGNLVMTRGVADLTNENLDFSKFVATSFDQYLNCDWGVLDKEDAKQNDEAVATGESRILAAYENAEHPDWKIWIITEWDRSATTILFPDEY